MCVLYGYEDDVYTTLTSSLTMHIAVVRNHGWNQS